MESSAVFHTPFGISVYKPDPYDRSAGCLLFQQYSFHAASQTDCAGSRATLGPKRSSGSSTC